MEDAQQVFDRGTAAYNKGDYSQAIRMFAKALELRPSNPVILNRMAVCQSFLGKHRDALATLHQAVHADPAVAETHLNFGFILQQVGRGDEALAAINRALRLQPSWSYAWFAHGNLLSALNRPTDAINSYDKCVAFDPAMAAAWLNRANAFLRSHRPQEAKISAEKSLSLSPNLSEAHLSIGKALLDMNSPSEAIAHFDRLLAHQPQMREAGLGRAQALAAQHQGDEALAAFDELLCRDANDADALNGKGAVLQLLNRLDDALACYDQALVARKDFIQAWVNRAHVLRLLDRKDESAQALQTALQLHPDCVEALIEMANLAAAVQMYDSADHWWDKARRAAGESNLLVEGGLAAHAAELCRWRENAEHEAAMRAAITSDRPSDINPFITLGWLDDSGLSRSAAERFARIHYPLPTASAIDVYSWESQRVRVAYVSGDFHNHATMILAGRLFELHDRNRFEVWGISIGPNRNDRMRQRAVSAFEHFLDARDMTDQEIADTMHDLRIEIAVDLKGFTQDARLGIFARRCAPIQVNYLGYPGTMGTPYHDFIMADRIVIPREHFLYFTERVVWLPDCYQVNDEIHGRPSGDGKLQRRDQGLPDDAFVYCCFNNSYKIKPEIFDIWMRVLKAVPGSVLWLWSKDKTVRTNLRSEAVKRGVGAERLVFAETVPHEEHIERLALADLFLDTLPYGAHTTASDALRAGLPILTCLGRTFPGRVAASLLTAAGITELICHSLAEYQSRAIRLGSDHFFHAGIRNAVDRARAESPIFDTDRFRRCIEMAYFHMREMCVDNRPFASFHVKSEGQVVPISE